MPGSLHQLDSMIQAWHADTFPMATPMGVIDKLLEEAHELKEAQAELDAFLVQHGEPAAGKLYADYRRLVAHRDEEWADVYITLMAAARYGVNAPRATDTKHKINLYRDWDTERMKHR